METRLFDRARAATAGHKVVDLAGPHLREVTFPDDTLVVSSHHFDVVRYDVSRVFKPHLLRLHGASADLQGRLHRMRLGDMSLIRLEYGAEVEIDPDRLGDFFSVQIPVAGRALIACGNRRFDSSPQAASLLSPTLPVHMRWYAGNAQVCLRFERNIVEQHCAAHLGHALDGPLEFEPEFRLDSPAGLYFLRLVELAAEELSLARQPGAGHHPLANDCAAEQLSAALLNALLYGQHSNVSAALDRPQPGAAPRFVHRAEDFIRHHYAEPLTVEKLAAIAGVSARTLFSGFRDFRSTTPMAYLRKIRLENARDALRHGENYGIAAVTKIALDCGFSHIGRFAAHYRAQFGEYPSQTARMKARRTK